MATRVRPGTEMVGDSLLGLETSPPRIVNKPQFATQRRQARVGIVGAEHEPMLCPRREHAVGLRRAARDQVEDLHRAVLARQVWDMDFDGSTNVVDVHVRRLRAKVDDPHEPKLIRTIRGLGYVISENEVET